METYRVERCGTTRFWAVRDPAGTLVCVCVDTRGATASAIIEPGSTSRKGGIDVNVQITYCTE